MSGTGQSITVPVTKTTVVDKLFALARFLLSIWDKGKTRGRRVMADRDIRANRLSVLAVIAAAIALPAMLAPGPKAKIELTTAQMTVLLETGPVRFRTFVSDSAQPTGLTFSIGRLA
jgi:hypothetical protein